MAEQKGLVHLIGSVPLDSAEAVFRQVSGALGPWLSRIPDGETGERARWIRYQQLMLQAHPDMEPDTDAPTLKFVQWDGKLVREWHQVRFRRGVDPKKVVFDIGYDRAAVESYGVFKRLRDQGVIAKGVRFQVCLPTPLAIAVMYVSPNARPAFTEVYERAMHATIRRILESIPATDLSIQYDVCQEVLVFENYFPGRPADYKREVFESLGRLRNLVPEGVELGFHLCYGSPADEHLVQPRDAAILVELMNGIADGVKRRIDFLHIPVPKDRTDDAFFAPLTGWRRRPETQLYLGLIHHADAAGDKQRIEVARRHVPAFGISSECGWGRTDPARLPGLLEAHARAAAF
jgi:hypothetical protein